MRVGQAIVVRPSNAKLSEDGIVIRYGQEEIVIRQAKILVEEPDASRVRHVFPVGSALEQASAS